MEPLSRPDIMKWRKAERARLLAERRLISPSQRHAYAAAIVRNLADHLGPIAGKVVSFYWPIRAEPNLLPLLHALDEAGSLCALPVVVEKGAPLLFRRWRDGEPLVPGIWNIPVPVEGDAVMPDIVIAPVIGFDGACYRLGYGGGFFDRTLAKLAGRQVFGVGYAGARIPTIHPLPHDIPMSAVITEQGTTRPPAG